MSLNQATNPNPGVADGNSSAASTASTETADQGETETEQTEGDEGSADTGTDDGQDGAEGDSELGDGEGGESQDGEAESEFAEVEDDEGAKHKIPAKLKGAFLKNADYTQKTQQHAETVRAFEAQQTIAHAVINELAELKGIDRQLAEYKKVDWDAFTAQNPDQANSAWRQFQLLKEQREDVAKAVQKKAGEVTENQQREHAKLVEAGRQQLQKDIPGWSDKLASDVVQYGASKFGFTREEIAAVTDPRMIKVLHAAMTNEQKSKTAAKVQNVLTAQQTRPAPQARSSGSSQPKDPNKMNPAQYRKWRAGQG
jgi:hypothetical protein